MRYLLTKVIDTSTHLPLFKYHPVAGLTFLTSTPHQFAFQIDLPQESIFSMRFHQEDQKWNYVIRFNFLGEKYRMRIPNGKSITDTCSWIQEVVVHEYFNIVVIVALCRGNVNHIFIV